MSVVADPASPRARLGPGAEFDLIRRFLGRLPAPDRAVVIGPGDDAAVLEGGWVASCDLSVEGIHFRRAWLSPHEIGFRAGAAALSDLAAMAAEPVGVLVSVAATAEAYADLDGVEAGVQAAAAAVGAAVLGGDTTRSPGPLIVDVVALGRAQQPVARVGAAPGDELWVTGALGASAAAVRALEAGESPAPDLRRAFAEPAPRVREALRLAELGAPTAMIDLSDGLVGDAGHLAAASEVKVVVETAAIPVAAAALDALGERGALAAALYGGEDYELCFAAAPGSVTAETLSSLGTALTRVGRIEGGSGVWLAGPDGPPVRPESGGFDHFAEPG